MRIESAAFIVLMHILQQLCNINIIYEKIIYLLAWIGVALVSCSDESSLPIQPEIPAEPETPKDEPAPEKDYHQLPVLHVEGRYLKNEKGETVNLHGFTQTYSPFLTITHGLTTMCSRVSAITNVW